MPRSPKKFQKRTLKNSLDHRSWDTKHSVILANYLRKKDQPDQPLTGKPVKAACPALKDFKAPTLNRKIKQVRGRLLENPDWDPRNNVEPMELNPSNDPANSDDDSDTDGDNEGTGAPRPSTIPSSGGIESLLGKLPTSTPSTTWQPSTPFPPNSLLAAASSTNSTAPTPPHTVRGIMYSKDVIRATQAMQSDLRLHELVRYQAQNGLMKLIVYLRIIGDTVFDSIVSQDGRTLTYNIQPAETQPQLFLEDMHHTSLLDPAATAVLQYFSNDPGTEVFKYVVTLPEAVDSNYEREYFISRAVKGVDASSGKQ
ncbi:hypothetical protein HDU79_000684, partial [Rhizoclosmatium sp. JEL0117]